MKKADKIATVIGVVLGLPILGFTGYTMLRDTLQAPIRLKQREIEKAKAEKDERLKQEVIAKEQARAEEDEKSKQKEIAKAKAKAKAKAEAEARARAEAEEDERLKQEIIAKAKAELVYDGAIAELTKLSAAASGNKLHAINSLLTLIKEIASGKDVNAKNKRGRTALMLAAGLGLADTVKLLIKAGAGLDARDEDGMTPLMWASINACTETASILIASGADLKAKSESGETALDLAGQGQNVVAIQGGMALIDSNMKTFLEGHLKAEQIKPMKEADKKVE